MSEHPRIQSDATNTGAEDALRRLLVEPTISIPDGARLLGIDVPPSTPQSNQVSYPRFGSATECAFHPDGFARHSGSMTNRTSALGKASSSGRRSIPPPTAARVSA